MAGLGLIAIAASVLMASSITARSKDASEAVALETVSLLSPDHDWRVRGSWPVRSHPKSFDVALTPSDDPFLFVQFPVDPRRGCAVGSECAKEAGTAVELAKARRHEPVLISEAFSQCGIPVLAVEVLKPRGTRKPKPLIAGWIDLEIDFTDENYPRELGRVRQCVLQWMQMRNGQANLGVGAASSVSFPLRPPDGSLNEQVLLSHHEITDHEERFRQSHYVMDLRDGELSALRLHLSSADHQALDERMEAELAGLLTKEPGFEAVRIGRLQHGLWVSRNNLAEIWAQFDTCRGYYEKYQRACVGTQTPVRFLFDRQNDSGSRLTIFPPYTSPMLFREETLTDTESLP